MENQKRVLFDSDNIRFNFAHVTKYVLKGWKTIVIGTIICAALVTAALYVLSNKNIDTAVAQETLDEKKEQLDKTEKEYEFELEYSKNSIVMKIQSKAVHINQIQFNVETADEYLASAMNAYLNYVKNGGLITDISEVVNIEPKYLQEILTVYYTSATVTKESSIFDIKIVGIDKESCDAIASAIEVKLLKYAENLNIAGITNQIKKIDSSYYIGRDSSFGKLQDTEKETLAKMKKQIETLKAEIQAASDSMRVSNKKIVIFAVLGIIVGGCIMVVVLLAKYIFNKNIKYAREIEECTGLTMLADNSLDEKNIDIAKARIKLACLAKDITDITFVGKSNEAIVGDMIQSLKEIGINCRYIGDIVEDAESISAMEKEIRVIWLVSSKDTTYNYLNLLGNCCEKMKADVLGYVYM